MDYDIIQGDYRIFIAEKILILQNLKVNKLIYIERNPIRIAPTSIDILSRTDIHESLKPHAILGILNLQECDFLVFVKTARLVGVFNTNEIYCIKEVEIIPITEDFLPDENCLMMIDNLKSFLRSGFYYSFSYDLTNSLQKQSKYKSSNVYELVEKAFLWNYNLYKDFFVSNVDFSFFCYLIQGYVGVITYIIPETQQPLTAMLVSRRNWANPYSATYSKGINEEGNVANFVETEQILLFDGYAHSYVHLRGNAPIHYEHSDRNVKVVKTPEQLKALFVRHIQQIQKDFHFIYFVNMLNANRLSEQSITTNLEYQFKISELSNFCKYHYFDLDDLSNTQDVENKMAKFIQSIDKVLGLFKFFCQDMNYGKVYSEQSGTMRVVCFDSLGKSNAAQMRIAIRIMELFINSLTFKVNTKPLFNDKIFNMNFQFLNHPFYHAYVQLWSNNGKELEKLYGESSVSNNFAEFFDQLDSNEDTISQASKETVDTFIQKNKSQSNMTKRLDDLLLYIGTWNLAGLVFNENTPIFDWLYPIHNSKAPDIYIVGFQEIVDLNPQNIMFVSNHDRVEYWKMMIFKNLTKLGNYILIKELNLVGILMMVFVKESIKNNITNLTGTIVKTGFLGTLGNKGNVIVRFDINNMSLAVSCCHLTSDLPKNDARIKELNDIMTKPVQITQTREMKFKEHNLQFVFGDLNFRIELENSMCRQMIKNGNLENLTVYDQFLKARSMNPLFFELEEGPLSFNPTYKYDFNSDEYDSSKKKRVPAWCDRILWRKNKSVKLVAYNVANYNYSDHRPVYGLFNISTQGRDLETTTKNEIKIEKKLVQTHSSNLLKVHKQTDNRDMRESKGHRSNSISANESTNTQNVNLIDLNFGTSVLKPQPTQQHNNINLLDFNDKNITRNEPSNNFYPGLDDLGQLNLNGYGKKSVSPNKTTQTQQQNSTNNGSKGQNIDFFDFFK